MKRTVKTFIILLVLFTTSNVLAQKKGVGIIDESNIVGTWEINFDLTMKGLEAEKRALYDSLSNEMKTAFDMAYKGRKLTFDQTGDFKQQSANGHFIEGSWRLEDNGKLLTLQLNGAGIKSFLVQRFESEEMTLLIKGNDSSSSRLVSKWILSKK